MCRCAEVVKVYWTPPTAQRRRRRLLGASVPGWPSTSGSPSHALSHFVEMIEIAANASCPISPIARRTKQPAGMKRSELPHGWSEEKKERDCRHACSAPRKTVRKWFGRAFAVAPRTLHGVLTPFSGVTRVDSGYIRGGEVQANKWHIEIEFVLEPCFFARFGRITLVLFFLWHCRSKKSPFCVGMNSLC